MESVSCLCCVHLCVCVHICQHVGTRGYLVHTCPWHCAHTGVSVHCCAHGPACEREREWAVQWVIYIQAAHALWRVQVRASKCELLVCGGFRANLTKAFCISIVSPFQIVLSKASSMFYSATDIDHILCIHTKSILHTKSEPLICISFCFANMLHAECRCLLCA